MQTHLGWKRQYCSQTNIAQKK